MSLLPFSLRSVQYLGCADRLPVGHPEPDQHGDFSPPGPALHRGLELPAERGEVLGPAATGGGAHGERLHLLGRVQ